jgi:hypothetical protein
MTDERLDSRVAELRSELASIRSDIAKMKFDREMDLTNLCGLLQIALLFAVFVWGFG